MSTTVQIEVKDLLEKMQKEDHLKKLAKLNPATLKLLAEMAEIPGIEQRLADNSDTIKSFFGG